MQDLIQMGGSTNFGVLSIKALIFFVSSLISRRKKGKGKKGIRRKRGREGKGKGEEINFIPQICKALIKSPPPSLGGGDTKLYTPLQPLLSVQ